MGCHPVETEPLGEEIEAGDKGLVNWDDEAKELVVVAGDGGYAKKSMSM